ncbi:uncharacterized protein LOC131153138 isoform X2 [Malania oleifera]|uniref:uncharacterized protein LOC131153138 isoform X2 n=1 Tax=Malania oleifera TaxID=397392 RepID=UPI0025AE0FBC|nr:uncharacterized protein LOC131153138 isoform X2 [Malania oleifera]
MEEVHKRLDECDGKEKETDRRTSSYLSIDILGMIMEQIHLSDQIHVRAVCSGWRRVQFSQVIPVNKLPCLMTHKWVWDGNILSICKFHLASVNVTCSIKHIMTQEDRGDIFGASICASKYGWLLVQKFTDPFVYNPFSGEIIRLPKLSITFNRATFSSIPTAQDCMYFVLQSSKSDQLIVICIYCNGDQEWKCILSISFPRYYWLHRTWVKLNSLGNQVFFLGVSSFSLSAGEETELADRIYFLCGQQNCYYSLRTLTYHRNTVFSPQAIDRSQECTWIEPRFTAFPFIEGEDLAPIIALSSGSGEQQSLPSISDSTPGQSVSSSQSLFPLMGRLLSVFFQVSHHQD